MDSEPLPLNIGRLRCIVILVAGVVQAQQAVIRERVGSRELTSAVFRTDHGKTDPLAAGTNPVVRTLLQSMRIDPAQTCSLIIGLFDTVAQVMIDRREREKRGRYHRPRSTTPHRTMRAASTRARSTRSAGSSAQLARHPGFLGRRRSRLQPSRRSRYWPP